MITRKMVNDGNAEAIFKDLMENPPHGHPANALIAMEPIPELVEVWAAYERPDTRFAAPYSKGYVDYLDNKMAAVKSLLETYHQGEGTTDMELRIWDQLEHLILMAKALQTALVG